MNFIKRFFAVFIAFSVVCSFPLYVGAEERNAVNVGSDTVIDNWIPKYYSIDDSIIFNNTKREIADITVTYKDNFSGYFWLAYRDTAGVQKNSEYIFANGSEALVTHTFRLYDAAFANGGAYGNTSSDFAIVYTNKKGTANKPENYDSLTEEQKAEYDSLSVSAVSVELLGVYAPDFGASTDKVGNIFFDDDVKSFEISFLNKHSELMDFAADYKVLNYDKTSAVGETQRRTYKVAAGKKTTDSVVLTLNKYGAFWLSVSLSDGVGGDMGKWDIPFSISPKSDAPSYDLGINAHINDGYEEEFFKALETLKKAGFGRLRHGFTQNEYHKANGVPALSQRLLNKASELGFKVTNVFRGNNDYLYGTTENGEVKEGSAPYMPKEAAQVESFSDYVYNTLKQNAGKISVAEIWNEPDLAYYSANQNSEQGPDVYAALLKNVYNKVNADETLSDVEIGGVSACEVGDWYDESWTVPVLEEAGSYLDRITIHHYTKEWDNGEDCHDTMADINSLEKSAISAKYGWWDSIFGDKKINFHHTEFGVSSIRSLGKEKQAERLSQYLLSLRVYRPDDEYFIYNFTNDGTLTFAPYNKEANFGLTESSYADVPYAAKPSFIAVANINSLIGGMENVSKISEDASKRVYSYANGDGTKTVYVMYAEEGATGSALTDVAINKPVTAYVDMYGNPISGDVQLSNSPIFAICDSSYEAPEEADTFAEFSQKKVRFTKGDNNTVYVTAAFPEVTGDNQIAAKVYNARGEIVQVEQLSRNENGEFSFCYTEKEDIGYSVWFGGKGIEGVYITSRDYDGGAFLFLGSENSRQLTSLEDWTNDEQISVFAQLDSWENPDFSIYCAGYKENALVNVLKLGLEDLSYNAGLEVYYADIYKSAFIDAEEIGIYIFKSDGTLIPLSRKVELK